MEQPTHTFNSSDEGIRLQNEAPADDQLVLSLVILFIVLVSVGPTLVSRLFSRRPRIFQIYNNQLNSSSFLPFSYLLTLHLEQGQVWRWRMPSLDTKFRFELLNAKQKRTVQFSVPVRYLISPTLLPVVLLMRSVICQVIKFFSFFSLSSQHNKQISFLLHRRKVLEQITSLRLDTPVQLDVAIYLHGLTVYSLNSRLAYYCAIEDYIQCNRSNVSSFSLSQSSNPKLIPSKKSLRVSGSYQSSSLLNTLFDVKAVSLSCEFADLFSPNYFQRTHPAYGVPMEYVYYQISKNLGNSLPRTLQENIAPIDKHTCAQLELLYYTNLGHTILLNLYAKQRTIETSSDKGKGKGKGKVEKPPDQQRIRAVLTENPLKFTETLVFYFFNLVLLLFTLLFGLNALVQKQRPGQPIALAPVLIVSPLFSLLTTELITALYFRFIKRHSRFINFRLFVNSLRQKSMSFAFVVCLLLATLSLLIWSVTLAALLKQNNHPTSLKYQFGFSALFLDAQQACVERSFYAFLREIAFLLALFYASLFVMLRFWTLLISLIRLAIARLVRNYYRRLVASLARKDPPIRVFKLASVTSLEEKREPERKSQKELKRRRRTTQSALDRELENNLLKYFTKK